MSIASYTYAEVKAALKAAGHVVSEGEAWVGKDLKAFETFVLEAGHKASRTGVTTNDPTGIQAAHHGFLYNCAPAWLITAIKGDDTEATTSDTAATDTVADTTAADQAAAEAAAAQAQAQAQQPPIEDGDDTKKDEVFVGSIDQGTTSSRFLIFNTDGEPVASHQIEFENRYPESG